MCVVCDVEFFTDPELPVKLDKLMDEREQLLRMNEIIKQLWPRNAAIRLTGVYGGRHSLYLSYVCWL